MICPRCGEQMEVARHSRGRGVLLIESRCTECGHYEVEESD